MKRSLLFFVAFTFATVTYAKPTGRVAGPEDPLPVIKVSRQGTLPKLDKFKPIFVESRKDPVFGEILKREFAARGFKVMDHASDEGIHINLGGFYGVKLPMLAPKVFTVDQLFSNGETAVGAKLYDLHEAEKTGGPIRFETSSAAGGIGMAIAQVTGLHSLLAKAFGDEDPRMICIWPCDNWDKYIQEFLVGVNIKQNGVVNNVQVLVGATDDLMHPVHLWKVALGFMMNDLFGDPLPPFTLKEEIKYLEPQEPIKVDAGLRAEGGTN